MTGTSETTHAIGAAGISAGLGLMGRRSRAVSDYWQAAAAVRQPSEFLALQLSYWSQLVDDYTAAYGECFPQVRTFEPEAELAPKAIRTRAA